MKSVVRIMLGAGLLYAAARMHQHAHDVSDKAIGVIEDDQPDEPLAVDDPRDPAFWKQPTREAKRAVAYFGEDPRERVKRPEIKRQLDEAIYVDRVAVLMAITAVVLIALGLWPAMRPVAIWLFVPEGVKDESKGVGDGKPQNPA
jgi:hypothetical protein